MVVDVNNVSGDWAQKWTRCSPIVTLDQLRAVGPKAPGDDLDQLNAAMNAADITNPKRAAAFIAQLTHECIEFTTFVEIWENNRWQMLYEGNRRLGNTQPGDGKRFLGRGGIQLTGRDNYTRFGLAVGMNFLDQPELVATPEWRYRASTWYWSTHGLNALADADDFDGITKAINHAMDGKPQRDRYHARAIQAFGAR